MHVLLQSLTWPSGSDSVIVIDTADARPLGQE